MSAEILKNLGNGGLVVIAVIFLLREVRSLMADIKPGQGVEQGRSGDEPVAFWRLEFRQANKEVYAEMIMPVLARHTQIMEDTSRALGETTSLMKSIASLLEQNTKIMSQLISLEQRQYWDGKERRREM